MPSGSALARRLISPAAMCAARRWSFTPCSRQARWDSRRSSRARFTAPKKPARAVLIGIWGYYDNYAVWQSLGRTVYSADVKIPGFWVGFEDGKRLRDQIAAGPTRIKVRLGTEMRRGLRTQSVYGTLPGKTDESIIVLAHMDGWFDAALDNASGLSVMLALAEHFAKIPQAERRRSIVFVGTAGHHVGSPNSPYLRDQRADLIAKTALMINCEHIAAAQTLNWNTHLREATGIDPRRWFVNGSPKLFDIVLDAYRTFGVNIVGDMDPGASGEMGAIDRIAPSLQLIHSPEIKHTDHDVPEIVPAVGIEAVAPRLRQDHRWGERTRSRGAAAGAARGQPAVAGDRRIDLLAV